MNDPVALAPTEHAIVLNRDTITELVVKHKTHVFRLQAKTETQNIESNEPVYIIEHRYESMTTWKWVSAHATEVTALNELAELINADFGYVENAKFKHFDTLTPPYNKQQTDTSSGFIWLELSEDSAVYIDNMKHLPVEFWSMKNENQHWYLGFNENENGVGYNVSIGTRENGKDTIDIVDMVENNIIEAVNRLCDTSKVLRVSPPTSENIKKTWEDSSSYSERSNTYQ